MSLANPQVTANIRADGVKAGLTPEKLLFVGTMVPTEDTAAIPGELVQNILNDGAEDTLFGANSPLAAAIRRARRRNPVTQFDAIGLEGASGEADFAEGTIAINGTASAAGTLRFSIGSAKFGTYAVSVAEGDTGTSIASNLAFSIGFNPRSPVTAVAGPFSVTLTAVAPGTYGNSIGLKIEGTVPGLEVSIDERMANGPLAADPDVTGVFDVIGNERYQGIVWEYTDETALSEVVDLLDSRFNVANNVLDGRAFVGIEGEYIELLNFYEENSQSLCVCGDNLVDSDFYAGPAVFELPNVKAASFAASRALRRTEDAILGGTVISRSPRDSFGGIWQNSKPYFNTPFPDCELPDVGNSFDDLEIEQLQEAGVWVIDANRARTEVIAGQVVTTYLTDAAGNPDPTFTFLNYVDTATAAREYIVNNTRAKYPQYRATAGELLNDVDSANEASVATFVAELYEDLGNLALVNTGVGTVNGETVDFDKLFRENLTVTLNPSTGKFFISAKLYIVVQFREALYDLAISFEV